MTNFPVSRRAFLAGASLASGAATAGQTMKPKSADPIERAQAFPLRKQTLERILAGREAFLKEVKPSPAQLRHGLELHYDSFVGEVQGSIQVANTAGLVGDRLSEDPKPLQRDLERQGLKGENLRRRLGKIHFKRKTFESAFDRQWIQESAAIYAMTNVQLATEDVVGPRENTFDTALERLARIDFVYRQRPDLIRVSSWDRSRGDRCGSDLLPRLEAASSGLEQLALLDRRSCVQGPLRRRSSQNHRN